jgi:hypothetical protein
MAVVLEVITITQTTVQLEALAVANGIRATPVRLLINHQQPMMA